MRPGLATGRQGSLQMAYEDGLQADFDEDAIGVGGCRVNRIHAFDDDLGEYRHVFLNRDMTRRKPDETCMGETVPDASVEFYRQFGIKAPDKLRWEAVVADGGESFVIRTLTEYGFRYVDGNCLTSDIGYATRFASEDDATDAASAKFRGTMYLVTGAGLPGAESDAEDRAEEDTVWDAVFSTGATHAG